MLKVLHNSCLNIISVMSLCPTDLRKTKFRKPIIMNITQQALSIRQINDVKIHNRRFFHVNSIYIYVYNNVCRVA